MPDNPSRPTRTARARVHDRPPPPIASAGDGSVPRSGRVRLRRRRERGSYDRAAIYAILDEGLVAHLGIVDDEGQPFVVPTLHARCGDVVYCHGSAAGRTMRAAASGTPVCLTVSLLDSLVLARSAMHHSANYRSAMILARARSVEDPTEKLAAAEAVVEHVVPGRWADVRAPSDKELRATAFLALPIDEASAKTRCGPPVDDEEDYALPAWAGVLPIQMGTGDPEPDPRLPAGLAPPAYLSDYRRPGAAWPRR